MASIDSYIVENKKVEHFIRQGEKDSTILNFGSWDIKQIYRTSSENIDSQTGWNEYCYGCF